MSSKNGSTEEIENFSNENSSESKDDAEMLIPHMHEQLEVTYHSSKISSFNIPFFKESGTFKLPLQYEISI